MTTQLWRDHAPILMPEASWLWWRW